MQEARRRTWRKFSGKHARGKMSIKKYGKKSVNIKLLNKHLFKINIK